MKQASKLLVDLNFKRDKYIKVIKVHNNHDLTIKYYNKKTFKPDFLVNDKHIFNHNGHTTVITSENKAETINPLELQSAYKAKDFKTAIESKIISETFASVKSNKLDLTTILLFGIAAGIALLLFLQYKGSL